MKRETYNELKDKYIYSISKNGLITTNSIDKKSYLFRSENDKPFKTFLFLIGENNKRFLMMVLREARGMNIFFSDDIQVYQNEPAPDTTLDPLPDPEPIPNIQEEIKEIETQLKKDQPDTELITPLYYSNVHEDDLVPSWWK